MYNTCQIWDQLQCNVICYKYYYLKKSVYYYYYFLKINNHITITNITYTVNVSQCNNCISNITT